MRTSVIIPTRAGDSPVLRRTLESLASQTAPPHRVIISLDDASTPEPDVAALDKSPTHVRIVRGENAGPAAARNRAFQHLDSGLVLFLNDDAVPAAECLEHHARAHQVDDAPSLVVGSAPWSFDRTPLRVIDRLVAETSLVFFYDQMTDPSPSRDWGYRHAWTLNLSVPCEALLAFDERFDGPMFDDLEWAHRMTRTGAAVRYAPLARVEHAHRPRYTVERLLEREARVGHAAHTLREANQACFADTFGSPDTPHFAEQDVSEEAIAGACQAFGSFCLLAEQSGEGIDIGQVYARCRSWRDTARAIGWDSAAQGVDFTTTAARVREAFLTSSRRVP